MQLYNFDISLSQYSLSDNVIFLSSFFRFIKEDEKPRSIFKTSNLIQASTNKLILLSIILSSNDKITLVVMDPVYLLNYLNSIIPKISVPSFISLSRESSYIGYNKINMFTPKLFSRSSFSTTICKDEFIDLESRIKL